MHFIYKSASTFYFYNILVIVCIVIDVQINTLLLKYLAVIIIYHLCTLVNTFQVSLDIIEILNKFLIPKTGVHILACIW